MRTAVMEGSLSEFDLGSVMQVVSLGRQYTGIELFDESGQVVGTLMLKSGKILKASAGPLSGLDAATAMLRRGRSRRFKVFRTEPSSDVKSPLGSVGDVLLKLLELEASQPQRVAVMEGSLSEFDLTSVLQVISIGRQYTAVEVFSAAGPLIGRIDLKAGMVVSASCGHLQGVEAIQRLVGSPRESRFVVHRSSVVPEEPCLGSLAQILMRVAEVDDDEVEAWVEAEVEAEDEPEEDTSRPAPKTSCPPAAPVIAELHTIPFGLSALPLPAGEVPVLAVTSPKGGAGKTTIAINLAIALVRRGKRVILVDGDFDGVLLALNVAPKALARTPERSEGSGSVRVGAFEVVAGRATFAEALVPTRIPGLRLVPSGSRGAAALSAPAGWEALFRAAKAEADVVLVDTSAGLLGPAAHAWLAATYALIVVPAEPTAVRALPAHVERFATRLGRPLPIVGVVLNMLDYRARVSLDALRDLCVGPSVSSVFDVPIARSTAFPEAVARGVPLCSGDRADTPTIGWVFEMLASSVLERLDLAHPAPADAPFL